MDFNGFIGGLKKQNIENRLHGAAVACICLASVIKN